MGGSMLLHVVFQWCVLGVVLLVSSAARAEETGGDNGGGVGEVVRQFLHHVGMRNARCDAQLSKAVAIMRERTADSHRIYVSTVQAIINRHLHSLKEGKLPQEEIKARTTDEFWRVSMATDKADRDSVNGLLRAIHRMQSTCEEQRTTLRQELMGILMYEPSDDDE